MSTLKSPIVMVVELVGISIIMISRNGNEKWCVHLRWFINCNYVQSLFYVYIEKTNNSSPEIVFENVCNKKIFLSYNIIMPC
jgi:hypothetical protein